MLRNSPRFAAVLIGLMPLLAHCSAQRPEGSTSLLAAGDMVPALSADDHRGAHVDLRALHAPALVYFYPKDGTPGCTKEACALRDAWERYTRAGVTVIGVSADSNASHREFAEQHRLPFSLVADEEHEWCDAFGVDTTLGAPRRMSFLIDARGKVAKVYPDVDPGVHAEEVLADSQALGLTGG